MDIPYILSFSGLFNGLAAFFSGWIILLKKKSSPVHRLFGLLSFSVALWSFAYWRYLLASNPQSALLYIRILSIGSTLIPIFFLHWVLLLTEEAKAKKAVLILGYLLTAIFLIFNFSRYFVKGVGPAFAFPYWPYPGILYHFYIIFSYLLLSGLGIYFLFRKYKRAIGWRRVRLKYIFFGSIIAALSGFANFPLWYRLNIPPYANFFVLIYVACFTYAMLRYRFMDIRIVISRIAVYSFSIALSFGFALALIFFNAQIGSSLSLKIILALIIFFSFFLFWLTRRFEELGARYFYPSFSKAKRALSSLERNLIYLLDLKTFSSLTRETLESAFLLEKIAILTKNSGENFIVQECKGFKEEKLTGLTNNYILVKTFNKFRQPLGQEDISRLLEKDRAYFSRKKIRPKNKERIEKEISGLKDLKRNWQELGIELSLPLLFQGGVIGLIFLGGKAGQDAFSREDIGLLDYFSRQASVALKNTLFYNEEKRQKEKLEKFYKITIDRELKMQELKAKIRLLEKEIRGRKTKMD